MFLSIVYTFSITKTNNQLIQVYTDVISMIFDEDEDKLYIFRWCSKITLVDMKSYKGLFSNE